MSNVHAPLRFQVHTANFGDRKNEEEKLADERAIAERVSGCSVEKAVKISRGRLVKHQNAINAYRIRVLINVRYGGS